MNLSVIRQCSICGDKNKKDRLLTSKNRQTRFLRNEFIVKQKSRSVTCSSQCAREHMVIHNNLRNKIRKKEQRRIAKLEDVK